MISSSTTKKSREMDQGYSLKANELLSLNKALPPKDPITSLKEITKQGPSVQIPEAAGEVSYSNHCQQFDSSFTSSTLTPRVPWANLAL